MPIAFRCPGCRKKLSTAKRKAGSTVACPGCGAEVRVPSAGTLDAQVEKLLAAAAAKTSPAAVEPNVELIEEPSPLRRPSPAKKVGQANGPKPEAKLNDLPLFERDDLSELLEKGDDSDHEPQPLPPAPPPTAPVDGLFVSRSTATMAMAAVAVLLGLAFIAGYLVGNRG